MKMCYNVMYYASPNHHSDGISSSEVGQSLKMLNLLGKHLPTPSVARF